MPFLITMETNSIKSDSLPLFKKRNIRRTKPETKVDSSNSDSDPTTIVRLKKKQKHNPNIQGTRTILPKVPKKSSDAADNEIVSDSSSSSTDKDFVVSYRSRKSVISNEPRDQGATRHIEIDSEQPHASTQLAQSSNTKKDKVSFLKKGPIKAPSNLRVTVRWDFQPDICKDYKETGYCVFGDSCKFLHDRSDYKHGWQLEREYEEGQYHSEDEGKYEVASDDDDDDIPFKCSICREDFQTPIITKCKHYFCEKCAIERAKTTTRCFVCDKQTSGVFNPARDLAMKIERAKQNQIDRAQSFSRSKSRNKIDDDSLSSSD